MAESLDGPLAELEKQLRTYPTRPPRFCAFEHFAIALNDAGHKDVLPTLFLLARGAEPRPTAPEMIQVVQTARDILEAILDATSNDLDCFKAWTELIPDEEVLKSKPYGAVPCANVDERAIRMCYEDGKLWCGGCRLVKYCSKTCQTAHWSAHKKHCRDPLLKPDWQPHFLDNPSLLQRSMNMLWDNVPAFDLLNLANNEGVNFKGDLSLAWLASHDLSRLVMTLNSLPLDYPGRIHVLLNHEDAPNIVRDAIILSILSTEGYAEEAAAEMAVHLSSSAFLPKATSETIAKWIVPRFIQGGTDALVPGGGVHIELQLHKENKLILDGDPLAVHVLGSFHERNKDDSSPSDYHNFMKQPLTAHHHQRKYCKVEPSHRLAFKRYFETGIVQPFGASTFDFTKVNAAFTLPSGGIDEVLNIGMAKGARREDLFGCLYFYLVEQYRQLAERLRTFKIDFNLNVCKPDELGKRIQAGKASVPSSHRFDRIDAGNSVGFHYCLYEKTFDAWAPLLNRENSHAALVASPDDWTAGSKGGMVWDLPDRGNAHARVVTEKLLREGKMVLPRPEGQISFFEGQALHNSAQGFRNYCNIVELDKHTKAAKLKLRERNSIVPHRILAPLGGSIDELPVFEDNEQWYRWVELTTVQFSEVYLEFEPV